MTSEVITRQITVTLCLVTFLWVCRLRAAADYTRVITKHTADSERPQTEVMNDCVMLNQTLLSWTNNKAQMWVHISERAFLLENHLRLRYLIGFFILTQSCFLGQSTTYGFLGWLATKHAPRLSLSLWIFNHSPVSTLCLALCLEAPCCLPIVSKCAKGRNQRHTVQLKNKSNVIVWQQRWFYLFMSLTLFCFFFFTVLCWRAQQFRFYLLFFLLLLLHTKQLHTYSFTHTVSECFPTADL